MDIWNILSRIYIMPYITYVIYNKISRAKYISLFFLFVILGLAIPTAQVDASVAEAHLKITKIGVSAVIKEMGMTSDGAMAVPSNRTDVGWFSLGTRPGEIGSAVIGAHNRFASKAGVFAHLDQLQKGDVLSVVDEKGVSISFVVRDMHTYDATDANTGIFESNNGVHLNLVTCSGEWNPLTKSSKKRLVVFTDLVEVTNKIAIASTLKI